MLRKYSITLLIAAILVGLMGLAFTMVEEGAAEVSINGVVCNHSSTGVWLSVSEGERQKSYALAPDHCTNFFKQDAEAIWGNDCSFDPCHYQAWKVSLGRFDVEDEATSTGSVLRIRGWGAGSRWHITWDWPKPDLSVINYSLVK